MKHIGIVNLTLGDFERPTERPTKGKVQVRRKPARGKEARVRKSDKGFEDLVVDSQKNRKRIKQINERIESLQRLASIEHMQVGSFKESKKEEKRISYQKENMIFIEEETAGVEMMVNTHKKKKQINNIEDVFKETPCDKKMAEPVERIEEGDEVIKQLFIAGDKENECKENRVDDEQESDEDPESIEAVSIVSDRDAFEDSFEEVKEEMPLFTIMEDEGGTECINKKMNNYCDKPSSPSKLEKKLIQSIYKEKLFRKLNKERQIKSNVQSDLKAIFGE